MVNRRSGGVGPRSFTVGGARRGGDDRDPQCVDRKVGVVVESAVGVDLVDRERDGGLGMASSPLEVPFVDPDRASQAVADLVRLVVEVVGIER